MEPTSKFKVLHVDDDDTFLNASKAILEDEEKFTVNNANSVDEALTMLEKESFDAIISDYEMPQKNGLDFLLELRQKENRIPFILFTGKGREEVAIKALNFGADGYFNKHGSPETAYGELSHGLISAIKRRQAEVALRESENRYSSLFSGMQEGYAYCKIKWDNKRRPEDFIYLEVNAAFEKLTGLTKEQVLGKNVTSAIPGIKNEHPELFEIYGRVASTGKEEKIEVFFKPIKVWLSINVYSPKKGYFIAIFDNITERKKTDQERQIVVSFLDIVNRSSGTTDLIEKSLSFFQEQSGCEAVGIRLKVGEDYPYYQTGGFPQEHIILENKLCAKNQDGILIRDEMGNPIIDCMCGNIIMGRFDPEKPFFTKGGSFWTNSTTQFLATTTDEDRLTHTRNRCNTEGYESLALIPLRTGGNRLGLLQLNDRRKNIFNVQSIELWERLARYLGVAVSKTLVEDSVKGALEEKREIEEKLKLLNEKLRVVGSLTRHDVRNKLSAIRTLTYIMGKKLTNPEDLQKIIVQIESTIASTNELLDFTNIYERIGSERLKPVNVGESFSRAIALFSNIGTIKISNECQDLQLMADSQLIQLFYNLIDNSLKHSPKLTRIHLHCTKNETCTSVVYEDDGIGVPEENKNKLFKEGFTTGGSGYGLYLINRLAKTYGWSVKENGESGKGARFEFNVSNKE